MKYYLLILVSFFLLRGETSQAQDLHFSQYYHALQNLNPALAGVMKSDFRFSGIYRSQWSSVPVPYLTYVGSFDMKYYLPGHQEGFFGGGLLFNYDQSGDARWRMSQFGLSLNYSRALNDANILTAGFQFSGTQRSLNLNALTFANQHNGENFDPSLPTKEENLLNNGYSFTDIGAGFNWNFVMDRRGAGRSSGNLGLGVFHLNRPIQDVYNNPSARLPFRFTLYTYAWMSFPGLDQLDFFLGANAQWMAASNEGMVGGDVRYHLPQKNGRKVAASLGLHYRFIGFNDALIPTLKMYYEDWTVGFSYDVNLSAFQVATRGRGGPEISAIYTITKVKALKEVRACPIF